jgi:phenylacetate-CoA ligase
MLTLPSGEKIWPWTPGYMAPIRQYQIIQHSLEEIEVKLVADRPLTAAEEEEFRSALTRCLQHPFRFRLERVDVIPRSAGGKYEDFMSLIDD